MCQTSQVWYNSSTREAEAGGSSEFETSLGKGESQNKTPKPKRLTK